MDQGFFFADGAGDQLVFAFAEDFGDGVPALGQHFPAGAHPDDVGGQVGQEGFYVSVFNIGVKDFLPQVEQVFFKWCHGRFLLSGSRWAGGASGVYTIV